MTEGNSGQPPADRTLSRGHASSGLDRVRAAARCGKRWSDGRFTVQRQSHATRLRAKAKEVREWLMAHRHDPVPEMGRWLRPVVRGYFNYHAVPGNRQALWTFQKEASRAWLWALRRRSQKGRCLSWGRMRRLLQTWLPKPCILHPYPDVRFHARHPR